MTSRLVPLDGAQNVRDIGGYRSVFGADVARGRVFRGDALSRLTQTGVNKLADLGLRTVIDFRTSGEILLGGTDRLPPGVTAVSLPVTGGELGAFSDLIAGGDHELQEEALGHGRAADFMVQTYRDFAADQRQRERFGAALRLIADKPYGLPLLYHCTSGSHRSGFLTALLLTALGVPREPVMRDYLLSNDAHRAAYAKLSLDLAKTGLLRDPGLLRPVLELSPSYLDAAYEEAWRRYGSFGAFLTRGLGVSERTLNALREALLALAPASRAEAVEPPPGDEDEQHRQRDPGAHVGQPGAGLVLPQRVSGQGCGHGRDVGQVGGGGDRPEAPARGSQP
jgi:protein-tyrosine phosphatase